MAAGTSVRITRSRRTTKDENEISGASTDVAGFEYPEGAGRWVIPVDGTHIMHIRVHYHLDSNRDPGKGCATRRRTR